MQINETVWRQVICAVYQPHLGDNGGPILVSYSPEGDTPTQVLAKARDRYDNARAFIRLRASWSGWGASQWGGTGAWSAIGPEITTISRGILAGNGAQVNNGSLARTGTFTRQVDQIPGYDHIVLTLEGEFNLPRNYGDLYRTFSPRGFLALQIKR